MKTCLYILAFFTFNLSLGQDYNRIIKTYLQSNRSEFALQAQDISDITVESHSFSKSLEAENVYIDQRYQGIKVFNATSSFAVKDGVVVNAKVLFASNITAKVNTTSPSISPENAVAKAAIDFGIQAPIDLNLLETKGDNTYVFSNGGISLENIPVQLVYETNENTGTLKLAWNLEIYLLDASHYYSVRVDAVTGSILSIHDWVVSCSINDSAHSNNNKQSILVQQYKYDFFELSSGGPAYRVFALPLIGPNEGIDQLIADPANATASPFGWHDDDGIPGADYTISRGNNVLAQDDIDGNNGSGTYADGGPNLQFDFPFDLPQSPINFLEASITNLFYLNNMVHDIAYHYGFDEASGNFQRNNYGNGGNEDDYVLADAQDGSGLNGANFSTPPDGISPRMQLNLWDAPGEVLGTFMTVNNGPLGGMYYAKDSDFVLGTSLPVAPITAELALMEDDNGGASTDPYDGCDNIINGNALIGNIAVVRRGLCAERSKVLKAEAEGAVAVIVVNDQLFDPETMLGNGAAIGIPAIMIYKEDGESIITSLINGDTINATLRDDGSGFDPYQRDADLDNVVVVHEYGHGISNRLTGGPQNSGCLQNEEQMGEGWSDFFGLIFTMKTGDVGEAPRGIGLYGIGEGIRGSGLRTIPYSTDMEINNFTYDDIKTQIPPHGVGSVWATMLWDLTWALIDEYGYDPDIYNGTGGNNIAMQLVVDGLKLQACAPGFVDGRDAILDADQIANGGANRCLIWNAFARRGLGLSADQGTSNSSTDGTAAFDVPPDCVLGVNDQGSLENNFIVYPNPSNGDINIKARIDLGDVTVSIFDMNGRKVYSQVLAIYNTAKINAGNLSSGVYLIQFDGSNYSQTTKLVIN